MVKKRPTCLSQLPSNGSKVVSPENLPDIIEELSISLNPDVNYYNDPDRFKLWSSYVYKYLKDRIKYSTLYLYPELSSTGRLHMHGNIQIDNMGNFYMYDVPYLVQLGNIEIDTICHNTCLHKKDDETCGNNRWIKYCQKQRPMMEQFTQKCLLYDKEGIMAVNT